LVIGASEKQTLTLIDKNFGFYLSDFGIAANCVIRVNLRSSAVNSRFFDVPITGCPDIPIFSPPVTILVITPH
jgi:hypothetical protein